MVKFKLIFENEETIIYYYYPEGSEENGIITVDKINNTIGITKLAPTDFSHEVSVEELNSLRNSVNATRIAEGQPELTEDEWPSSTQPEVSTFYADHVIARISDAINKGKKLERGTVTWY
ncbi:MULTISPECIES: hypothetical protein [unclassified Ruminococcus]|uniref:hypothetical protein n=1 Tax=unclassified Ruminococcus TaxID=2608920 RepID=UPI00210E5F2A|nr:MULTISPECIES: hypothetical protein [unclassified Ruminococcus]MCQ4023221.1 hypothetical protein [Ruminococcus sp. zg-924]MCQ4115602.1 hypothetical protein [Ruminococcus sp. zg-921]